METKDARRRRKLEMLIAATKDGLEAIAVAARRNPDYLKQIIKGTLLPPKKDGSRSARALGDDTAEAIEDAFDLGRGWFDSDRPVPDLQPKVQQIVAPFNVNGWPFLEVTKDQYFALLSQGDRDAIEATAIALVRARSQATKHNPPAPNIAAA